MTFLSVGSQLCRWLPSDPSSRKRPCLKLVVVVTRIYKSDHLDVGSPTGDFHPISSRPCWAYTIWVQRIDRSRLGEMQRHWQPLTRPVRRATRKSFGGVGKDSEVLSPCQCSSRCPPRNVQPVMGGQYQQKRLNVEAPLKPNRGCRLGQGC